MDRSSTLLTSTIQGQIIIAIIWPFIYNINIKKRRKNKCGKYATTGGHCKTGESSIQGILNEIKEEIGLEVKVEDLQLY